MTENIYENNQARISTPSIKDYIHSRNMQEYSLGHGLLKRTPDGLIDTNYIGFTVLYKKKGSRFRAIVTEIATGEEHTGKLQTLHNAQLATGKLVHDILEQLIKINISY
jgi:hypothetical protein